MMSKLPRNPKIGEHVYLFQENPHEIGHILCVSGEQVYIQCACSSIDRTKAQYKIADYGITWRFADETPAPDDITDRLDEAHSLGFRHGLMLREQLSSDLPAQSFAVFEKWVRSLGNETPAPEHDVCESSRDCIICSKRILPAGGICFSCATNSPERKPRELTDEEADDQLELYYDSISNMRDSLRSVIAKYEIMRPELLEGG